MTRDQAKEILACYRDHTDFPYSEELETAMAMLESDPELQAWFQQEQDFDASFSEALQDIDVPANLRRDILNQYTQPEDKNIQISWWQIFNPVGMAAALFLMAGILMIPWHGKYSANQPASLETLQDFAIHSLKQSAGFDFANHDQLQLIQHLEQAGVPAPSQIPGKLQQLPTSGCMALEYDDRMVGLVCFEEATKSNLFVMNKEDFPELDDQPVPVIRGNAYASSAFWTRDGKHYLLFINDSPDKIAELITY